MKRSHFFMIFIMLPFIAGCSHSEQTGRPFGENAKTSQKEEASTPMGSLRLKSSSFEDGGTIPSLYTCDGRDVNPPLTIAGVPEGIISFALIVDDPDAPAGNFDHWIVWNIAGTVTEIRENSVPDGATEGKNDFRRTSYGGPCPPSGAHRYQFKLYALDTKLNLALGANKKDVEKAMQGHVLGQELLVGLYTRK